MAPHRSGQFACPTDNQECSAVWYSSVQCTSVQCSAVHCSVLQCYEVQYSVGNCSNVRQSIVQCSSVQCSAVCASLQVAQIPWDRFMGAAILEDPRNLEGSNTSGHFSKCLALLPQTFCSNRLWSCISPANKYNKLICSRAENHPDPKVLINIVHLRAFKMRITFWQK